MKNTLIGYARCSTDKQDLSAQKQALLELGVSHDLIYTGFICIKVPNPPQESDD
jgi:DNA invertase Pin-like site-specific DNA recombinase